MTDDANLIFLPWSRRGAATALMDPDTFTATRPGVVATTASIRINAAQHAQVPVTVMGPGHVRSLDRRQIIRTDPPAGTRSFEPNFLPLVEFDEPSLPWLFTPAAAGQQSRLRPWLCLVVVRKQTGVSIGAPIDGTLPVLRISAPAVPANELPDLGSSWAWAHVSVVAESSAGQDAVTTELDTMPERSLSRLLCPRILAPNADYVACVVPTFELGRKAGLGKDLTHADEASLADAWSAADASVELPVYFQWEFSTGAGGDFLSLALLLRKRDLPPGLGMQPIDVGSSGLAAPVPAGTRLNLAGALRPVGSTEQGWPSATLKTGWESALIPVLNAPAAVTDQDPLLAPPLYGAAQSGWSTVSSDSPDRWFEVLNLAPSHRAVAHLGAAVVQAHQDQLMASAWAQAADLARANEMLRRMQLACQVSTSLHTRHLSRMDPAAGLQVLAPARARLVRGPDGAAVAEALRNTGLGSPAYSTALRRMARPRGGIARRAFRSGGAALGPNILSRFQLPGVIARVVGAPVGPVTLETVAAGLNPPLTDIAWSEGTAAAVTHAPPRPWFAFVPMGVPVPVGAPHPTPLPLPPTHLPVHGSDVATTDVTSAEITHPVGPAHLGPTHALPGHPPVGPIGPVPPVGPIGPPIGEPPGGPILPSTDDSAAAALFRHVASELLARFNPPPIVVAPPPTPPQGGIVEAFGAALAATTPAMAFPARLTEVVDLGTQPAPPTGVPDPIRLAPYFPQPMVEPLIDIAQELVLPGLETVLPNTVVPLETDRPFVDSYLVGLNTEMGREMLWREFPTDLRATFFDRFWNSASAPGREPDIPAIATWTTRPLGGAQVADERFVLLVRSELLLRYPDAIIYATKDGETSDPIFTGGFQPDVRYFGFDIGVNEIAGWSIVIQEHPSAPRFGVDVGADTGGGANLPADGANSAATASQLRREPVRVTIPVSVLLGTP